MIEYLRLDFVSGVKEVALRDDVTGERSVARDSGGPFPLISPTMKSASIFPGRGLMIFQTAQDQIFEADLGFGPALDKLRMSGRPVVYIDQNHWIYMTQSIHEPHLRRVEDVEAYMWLYHAARDRRIILPLSRGHMMEIVKATGRWRSRVVPTMLECSRGWWMYDPGDISQWEIQYILKKRFRAFPPEKNWMAFGLEPGDYRPGFQGSDKLSLADMARRASYISAIYVTLLNDEKLEMPEDSAGSWADYAHGLALWLRDNKDPKRNLRMVSLGKLISDRGVELERAARAVGLRASQWDSWLRSATTPEGDIERDLTSLPCFGRYRDVLHLRIINAQDKWEANDLTDMTYLPCASAYADYVLPERLMGDYLRRSAQSQRREGAFVARNIRELVGELKAKI